MRIAVNFTGRVQGVGFRVTARGVIAQRSSPRRPLTGWVRNEPDGSVQMELQGDAVDVEAALGAVCDAMGSKILAVGRAEIPESVGETGFVISR